MQLVPDSAFEYPPWWWLGRPETDEEEAVLTVLAHGIDPAAPPTMDYAAASELSALQATRHRAQLILLHRRALPWLELVVEALQRLAPGSTANSKLLQVGMDGAEKEEGEQARVCGRRGRRRRL